MPTKLHVVPDGLGWSVKREGQNAPISTHRRQDEAIDCARIVADKEDALLVVHPIDSLSSNSESYAEYDFDSA